MNVYIKYENCICYDRMDVSEGFDDNKTSASKECGVSHCWYF